MSELRWNQELTQEQLEQLLAGSEVADWEGDILEKEGADAWRYRDYPMRNDKRTFDSEILHRAYGPVKLVKAAERIPAPAQPAPTPGSIRDRARRAAWMEWDRRWTLGEQPNIHRFADAIADAVVDVLFPGTAQEPRANQVHPAPVPAVQHASLQEDQ